MAERTNEGARAETSARDDRRAAEAKNGQVSVLLVDDHAILRGGVRSLLEDTEFSVVGEASSASEAVETARRTRPRLVLLDIRMAGGDGFEALQALKALDPQIVVVMLTTYDNPAYMARAAASGAAGYLLKGASRDELLATLRTVMEGDPTLRPQELAHSLHSVSEEGAACGDLIEPLTVREVEVLRLLAAGLCNRDIAAALFIAEGTAKTHVEHIIGKLGVSDRVQAAVWAARQGLITPQRHAVRLADLFGEDQF